MTAPHRFVFMPSQSRDTCAQHGCDLPEDHPTHDTAPEHRPEACRVCIDLTRGVEPTVPDGARSLFDLDLTDLGRQDMAHYRATGRSLLGDVAAARRQLAKRGEPCQLSAADRAAVETIIAAEYGPPVTPQSTGTEAPGEVRRYGPDLIVDILIAHQRHDLRGCLCGPLPLGSSHAQHVNDIVRPLYEARVRAQVAADIEAAGLDYLPVERAAGIARGDA